MGAQHTLILGGQKSGKSRQAEMLAMQWLQAWPGRRQVVFLATAQPLDAEMRARIERHQQARAQRLPAMTLVEEPLAVAQAVKGHSRPDSLVVVDCLTLWLTNWLMPIHTTKAHAPDVANNAGGAANGADATAQALLQAWQQQESAFIQTLQNCPGPVVMVSNEVGLGVIPLGAEVRQFVDCLGLLNQAVAACCANVTLMAAGLALPLRSALRADSVGIPGKLGQQGGS